MKKIVLHSTAILTLAVAGLQEATAQGPGTFSGDLMLNGNFFQRDSAIGAAGNDLYDKFLSGGEGWLSLRYSNYGFTGFLRLDVFNNSNLRNPLEGMSGFGIGAWSINKEFKGLSITGGYIYDQIGSGIIFRSYEDRGLLIDNALAGLHLKYKLDEHITLKAFTGQQKNIFERYKPIIKGFNAEGDFNVGKSVHITPGVGIMNRTLDNESYTAVYNNILAYADEDRFTPKYNTYAITAYNTLSAGDFTWYIEGAYKTKEAINDYNAKLVDKAGNIVFTTLSYARKGFAASFTGKRTENFVLRTSPNETAPNSGMVNWQPIVAQIRPQRLIARYTPASQDLSELAGNLNVLISPSENLDLNLSYTHINTLNDLKLYREVYGEANFRSDKLLLDIGLQYMEYNQDYYQFKPGVPIIKAVTPFAEATYLFNSTNSLKIQAQTMFTKQDYGSWAFLALEYAIAPKWSFAVSDMYNFDPAHEGSKDRHYYNVFVSRTQGAHRISLAYVKQVDGINCTGGVCRYEPAFSGVKLSITSSF